MKTSVRIALCSLTALAGVANAQSCGGDEAEGWVYIAMSLSGSDIEFVSASAFAGEIAVINGSSCPLPHSTVCSQEGTAGESDSCFCSAAIASADSISSQGCEDAYQPWGGDAISSVSTSGVFLYLTNNYDPECSAECESMTGSTWAIGLGSLQLDSAAAIEGASISVELPSAFSVATGSRQFGLAQVLLTDTGGDVELCYSVIETSEGTDSTGLTYDSGNAVWTASSTETLDPGQTASAWIIMAPEHVFDVDGSGRLNTDDSDALDAIVGTGAASDAGNVRSWDFDGSGVIDSGDVAVIDLLLDRGLGAGRFADADADGDTDCDDYDTAVSDFIEDSVLGDGDYIVEFDYDLDGDNDQADWCEIRALLNPADYATPYGTLDFSDVLAFNTLFAASDPKADLATPYGTFDFSDVLAFNVAFANGCP